MKKITYLLIACIASSYMHAQIWTKMALPETGKTIIDLKEDASGNLYALTSQGLFKSSDKAANWSLLDRSMRGVELMTVAPNGDVHVDEASSILKYNGTSTSQVSWYRWATNATTAAMVSLSDGKLIYTYLDAASQQHKYFTSIDNGANFTQSTTVPKILFSSSLQAQLMTNKNDQVFYLGHDKNLYKSTDKGVTYSASGTAISALYGSDGAICIDKEKSSFYSVQLDNFQPAVFKTIDDGVTWSKVSADKIYATRVAAHNDVVVANTKSKYTNIVHYSSDGGATWTDKSSMFKTGEFPEKILIASDGKVYGTNLGDIAIAELDLTNNTITPKTKGLDFTNAEGLSYNGTRLAGCLSSYAHYTDDNGATWKKLKGPGANSGNTYVSKTGKVYTASRNLGTWGGVYVQDANDSMVAVTADVDQVWNMHSMFEDDKESIYCISNLYGLYKSSDGTSFTKMVNAPFDNLNDMTMWFSESNKRIYAILHNPEEVHYSDDYGVTWTKGTPVSTLVKIHFKGEGLMWVYAWSTKPAETGFYYSSDLAAWSGPYQSATGFDDRWSQPFQGNSGKLYAAKSDNAASGFTVISSSDTGKTWTPFASGLDTVSGFAINGINTKGVPYNQILTAHDKLYLGTNGSIYMANQSGGPIVVNVNQMEPSSVEIYPNPAQNILHINNKTGLKMDVVIYDMMGRVTKQVENIDTNIDVSSLPNGSYILEIRTDEQIEVARFTISR